MDTFVFLLICFVIVEIGHAIVNSYKDREIAASLLRENIELKKKLGE